MTFKLEATNFEEYLVKIYLEMLAEFTDGKHGVLPLLEEFLVRSCSERG
jgi:hypothetical protein